MPNESPAEGAPEPASPFPPAFRWETATQEAQHPAEVHDSSQPVGTRLDESITRPSDSSAPPWADSDLPPMAEQQSAWLHLGPEVFQGQATQSRFKQIIGITVLTVVILGLAGAAVMYFLAGGSPAKKGSEQITAPPTTAAPRARPALPSVPASASPVTAAPPVTAAAPVTSPAAPMPAVLPPSPPFQQSAGGSTEERYAAAPVPHNTARPRNKDLRQGANSQNQPQNQPSPPSAASPPPPAPSSAPEGWTRVPAQPWKPQAPQ
jgi:hypothetical protein